MRHADAIDPFVHTPADGSAVKPTVLIVDDDDRTITLFTAILEQAGYPIIRAGSAMSALNQSAGTRFDIALIDRHLRGGVGGTELLTALKGARPDLVAIIVTGDTSQTAVVEALRAGAFDYLTKPVQPDFLLHTLEKAERKIQADREMRAQADATAIAKQDADATNQAKSRLLEGIKWQLREPLNTVVGFSELLADKRSAQAGDRETVEYAETIRESSAQLLNIVNDALDLIQIETQQIDFNVQPLEISPIMERTAKLLKEKAAKSGVMIVCRPEADNLHAIANERRLREIIKRVLAHALNVVEPGCQITIASAVRGGQATIQVLGGLAAAPKNGTAGDAAGETESAEGTDGSVFAETHLSLQLAQALARFIGGELEVCYPAQQAIQASLTLPAAIQTPEALAG
ncbi:MAG: response regulator [Pseudomonadota bacterium]